MARAHNPLSPRLLALRDVVLDLSVHGVREVYDQVASRASRGNTTLLKRTARLLMRRHERRSVAIGNGLALPHAAIPGLTAPRAFFLRCARALDLKGHDGRPVLAMLVLLVPFPALSADNELLLECMRFLSRREVVDALIETPNPAAIYELLTGHSLGP